MSIHPKIFFRNCEIEKLQQDYYTSTKKITEEANDFFASINSLDQLYFKVQLLENSKSILNGFKSKTMNFNTYKGIMTEQYVDPFSVSPTSVMKTDFTGSEFIFYLSIFMGFALLISLFTKFKTLKKLLFALLVGLTIYNFINYYVVEPNEIQNIQSNINLKDYEEKVYADKAYETFDKFYDSEIYIK